MPEREGERGRGSLRDKESERDRERERCSDMLVERGDGELERGGIANGMHSRRLRE